MAETGDRADPIGFTDVDATDEPDVLLIGMDATAAWPAVQELHEWSRSWLEGSSSLLDVGCGQGYALMRLAETSPGGHYLGVDTSDAMLQVARARADAAGLDVTFRHGSALDLPFADDEFEASRCERLLQWLPQPRRAVEELVRVTRPGGRVVLLDTDWRTFGTTVDPALEATVLGGEPPWPCPHAGGFLRRFALQGGLERVEVKPVVHHATTWVDDSSDGLFSPDMLLEIGVAGGVERADVERYLDELRRQSGEGTLSIVLTMWGAAGTVPH